MLFKRLSLQFLLILIIVFFAFKFLGNRTAIYICDVTGPQLPVVESLTLDLTLHSKPVELIKGTAGYALVQTDSPGLVDLGYTLKNYRYLTNNSIRTYEIKASQVAYNGSLIKRDMYFSPSSLKVKV